MTRVIEQAKIAISKVKQAVAPMVDIGRRGETRLLIIQKIISTTSKAHLLGMEECLKILEDSIP